MVPLVNGVLHIHGSVGLTPGVGISLSPAGDREHEEKGERQEFQ